MFIDNGFTVANVEYRLAKQAPAPAALEDVNCALAYLSNHAKKYQINPARIILIRGSAGGHLALLLGLQSVNPVYDQDCQLHQLKIAGIISKYGATDLMTWKPSQKSRKCFIYLVGRSDNRHSLYSIIVSDKLCFSKNPANSYFIYSWEKG